MGEPDVGARRVGPAGGGRALADAPQRRRRRRAPRAARGVQRDPRAAGTGPPRRRAPGSDRWRHRAFGFVVSASPHLAPEVVVGRSATSRRLVSSSSAAGASAGGAVDVTITTLAEQAPSVAAWERRAAELHEAHRSGGGGGGAAAAAGARAHGGWWDAFWNRSHIHVWAGANATNTTAAALRNVTARYAQTRYLQAIQAGTWVPIKFNGQLWTAQLPPETNTSGPSYRDWGAANWWQNTRLAYGSMLMPGDYDSLTTIFDYYLQMVPLLSRRTPRSSTTAGSSPPRRRRCGGCTTPATTGTTRRCAPPPPPSAPPASCRRHTRTTPTCGTTSAATPA